MVKAIVVKSAEEHEERCEVCGCYLYGSEWEESGDGHICSGCLEWVESREGK